MILDPQNSIDTDVYCFADGKPWRTKVWPAFGGVVGIVLCQDCGEIDVTGRFFEKNAVYSNMGDLGDNEPDGTHRGCNVCKSMGFNYVGL